jgi:hypothetical protein
MEADGSRCASDSQDAYEILQLGTAAFVYRHYEMGDTFRHRRVGPEFNMPELTGS